MSRDVTYNKKIKTLSSNLNENMLKNDTRSFGGGGAVSTTENTTNKEKIKTLFSSLNEKQHVLYLYNPTADKYAIHSTFLESKKDKTAYVSNEREETIRDKFKSIDYLEIIPAHEIEKVGNYNRIIIDGDSFNTPLGDHPDKKPHTDHRLRKSIGEGLLQKQCMSSVEREKYLCSLKGDYSILCTYNILNLNQNEIKNLVKYYDKLIITTNDTVVFSANTLSSENLNLGSELIDEFLKNELETVVLALLVAKPMCGTAINKIIYDNFGILLSPGTLYPLLHKLQKNGLLKCEYGIKTKTYGPVNEKSITTLLEERMKVKNFLTSFVQTNMMGGNKCP